MQTNAAVAEAMVEKMKKRNETSAADRIRSYLRHPGSGVLALLTIGAAVVTFAVLIFLVAYILVKGIPYLTPSLFSLEYTSENVSLMPSLINTFIMTALSLVIAAPLGIFAAIYLVEYAKKGNKLVQVIRITAETLSGIPSIVYGLFGMLFFVTALHWGMSLLAGACTLVIMVLPLIMRTAEEALKAVPDSYREASFGLRAGKLRTIFTIVLPSAVPGILAGIILAIGRIIGETAALLYTSGTVAQVPNLMGSGRTLALHMYVLSSEGLHMNQASATAVVILLFVLIINGLSLNRMNDLVEGCKITGKGELDGEDIYGDMDVNVLRKRVGMVFQKPNPFPMSIYDNVAYGPRTHGIRSKAKLDEIVEKSLRDAAIWDEVKDRLKKSALGMSGGQQQRLCIARALAVEPEVLLMDEPTSALDPISTSKIEELAMELKGKYTIVIVTHNMQQATRISDKTAFFLLGEVVEFSDTDTLFSMPKDKRTEDYITGRFG